MYVMFNAIRPVAPCVGIAMVLLGCRSAPPSGGHFACGDDQLCPAGQTCSSDGRCYGPGEQVDGSPDASRPDARLADAGPTFDAQTCSDVWDPLYLDATLVAEASPDLVLETPGTWTLNTSTQKLRDPSGVEQAVGVVWAQQDETEALLLAVRTLIVGPGVTLRAIGGRPLLIGAYEFIRIEGAIDVSSRNGDGSGAGSGPDSCANHKAGTGVIVTHAGGGGGAGYQAPGGRGGDGNPDGTTLALGGAGGGAVTMPAVVAGGCRGGRGGGNGGSGGLGGGAILLAARCELRVNGVIEAGGAGGAHGIGTPFGNREAAGGGGSGGWIGLDAFAIDVASTAVLATNGGGGGGGAVMNENGTAGQDGRPTITSAMGGVPVSGGGVGGTGGAIAVPPGGAGGMGQDGGSGGGGGVGFIVVRGTAITIDASAVISPAITTPGS